MKKQIIDKGWMASGYGRGYQQKLVYEINGFAYGYYPKYAQEAFEPLQGELKNYVPLNYDIIGDNKYFYQCNPSEHKSL